MKRFGPLFGKWGSVDRILQSKRSCIRPLRIEALEPRRLLAGNRIAMVVAGLGGADIPPDVVNELVTLGFRGVSGSGLISNWNSINPGEGNPGGLFVSFDSQTLGGDFDVPGISLPGLTIPGVTVSVPSITIPFLPSIQVDIGVPNTSNDMVSQAVNSLNRFDDDDTIVLLGHSLGGNAVLEIARRASVEIDLLATLDPVGFAPSDSVNFTGLLPIPLSFPNGTRNDNGETPGFRSNIFGGGLPSVPDNVRNLYNRWQTNAPFPLDFPSSGNLEIDGGFSGFANQASRNSRPAYDLGLNADSAMAVAFGHVDLNPIAIEDVCVTVLGEQICAPDPTTAKPNADFGKSTAQFHADFPRNEAIQADLISLIQAITPAIEPDAFESNNTLQEATIVGSPSFATFNKLTIHDESDVDMFEVTASATGSLKISAFFDGTVQDLGLRIRDGRNNIIATDTFTAAATPFSFQSVVASDPSNPAIRLDVENVVVPVVAQEKYFVELFSVNETLICYDLEVENFPTPVPTGVHLDPASDTGMMNNDGVTSQTSPTFFIQTDVLNFVDANRNDVAEVGEIAVLTAASAAAGVTPGIGVEVTLVNTTAGTSIRGFADPVLLASPEVYRFTPADPLTPGVYLVSARTRIFDGQRNAVGAATPANGRSNASPPLWITIDTSADVANQVSADLIASSDTGMLNADNVTNKMSPAFNGIAPAGSKVRLYANGQLVGQTVAGSDTSDVGRGAIGGLGGAANDGLGLWEITSEPLADAAYDISLEVEDAAGNVTIVNPTFHAAAPTVDIVIDTLEPNTPYLELLDDTGRTDLDDVTKVNTPRVSMTTSDPNAALAQLLFTDNLKFRIFDRFDNDPEILIYDSTQDATAFPVTTAADLFTSLTQLTRTLPVLTPPSDAIVAGALADGLHNLKLEVEDRAGNISHDFLLEIFVDTATPPVSFGLPAAASAIDGLAADSDSGTTLLPATFADRITNDTTPRLWGRAEANSIVRVYLDRPGTGTPGTIDLDSDFFLGQTVAIPYDGNDVYPDGYWEITSTLDLNQLAGVPKDGLRSLLVTAEDLAGNPMPMNNDLAAGDALNIFIDTQGPQVNQVFVAADPTYDLFDPKPSTNGFSPLISQINIDLFDQPSRLAAFPYDAVAANAQVASNYLLVGDHVGTIAILSATLVANANVGGMPATAQVQLRFGSPLPDDRYTLSISDSITDPVGNMLDGESNSDEPQENPLFPSGDGVPGTPFVARFTVDSRPEIGTFVAQAIDIDINGNFAWDPANAQIGNDATNVDIKFTMDRDGNLPGAYGTHDLVFAGKFVQGVPGTTRLFDQLGVYGWCPTTSEHRWLIDLDSDGVGELYAAQPVGGLPLNFDVRGAIPVAGNFDRNANNGDEIGLYNAGKWAFDLNRNFVIDAGDLFLNGNLLGHPIVGDFDGNGDDDLAVFNNNTLSFDMNPAGFDARADQTLIWGFPGVLDRPVAADMNQDGVDDIGLFVPRNAAQLDRAQAEWYFILSTGPAVAGTIAALNHPFAPIPFGVDLYAEFGDELALPIIGNFDPPVARSAASLQTVVQASDADFDHDGRVDGGDFLALQRGLGAVETGFPLQPFGDADHSGVVAGDDLSLWAQEFGVAAPSTNTTIAHSNGSDFLAEQRSFGAPIATVAIAPLQSLHGAAFLAWQRGFDGQTPSFSIAAANAPVADAAWEDGADVDQVLAGIAWAHESREVVTSAVDLGFAEWGRTFDLDRWAPPKRRADDGSPTRSERSPLRTQHERPVRRHSVWASLGALDDGQVEDDAV